MCNNVCSCVVVLSSIKSGVGRDLAKVLFHRLCTFYEPRTPITDHTNLITIPSWLVIVELQAMNIYNPSW